MFPPDEGGSAEAKRSGKERVETFSLAFIKGKSLTPPGDIPPNAVKNSSALPPYDATRLVFVCAVLWTYGHKFHQIVLLYLKNIL